MDKMTSYTHKLESALIDTGKAVERSKAEMTPILSELEDLFIDFQMAVKSDDMMKQIKAAKALTAAIVKWQIEKL